MRESESLTAPATANVSSEIEKRQFPRTREYGAQRLLVTCLGEAGAEERVDVTLWDFSEGGLGIESPRPFAPGEELKVKGELHGADYSMEITARTRVAYSRAIDAEFFRVGMAFIEVSYRRLS
jgi:hypothetical protein